MVTQPLPQVGRHGLTTLLRILQVKDIQLYRHSYRVQYLSHRLVQVLHLPKEEETAIGLGALLHDIGKIYIQDAILQKATQLTQQELEVIKRHPAYGASILNHFERLQAAIPIVYAHHEHWDGAGYPRRLRGNAIPLGARIVAIADAFEAMTSRRAYQRSRTPLEALEELQAYAGTQFDPYLVDRFCNIPYIKLLTTTINQPEVEPAYLEVQSNQTAF
jgi:putative nucleotidyltransferase with HDIG domain